MMIVSKANIKLIYQNLLAEGVMVVKKDTRAPSHDTIPVPNLQVMKVMQSLKSRGFVKEEFNWQYHYFFLTDEGLAYLREYLHVGESVVPATHVGKPGVVLNARNADGERRERAPRARKGDDGEYRKAAWRRPEGETVA